MTDQTVLESIGRLLMIGFEGETFTPDLKKLLGQVRPGGIILFRRNVGGGPAQVADLVAACRETAVSEWGRDLMVAIDQEGGPVKRLESPFFQAPSQRRMAETMSVDEVRAMAETGARELKAVGINFNLTPVLDLSTDPEARFMYERSFADDPEKAAQYGLAVIDGHGAFGVLTCLKHFPGIGATRLDPHEVLPTVDLAGDRIMELETRPFAEGIRHGAPAVMTSHIQYPGLDPEHPATFSRIIITDILRKKIGFKGLVLTDDMEMGAIVKHYKIGPSAVHAVLAGSDMVLVCHLPERILEARDALANAVGSGEISRSRIQESLKRLDDALAIASAPPKFALREVFPFV